MAKAHRAIAYDCSPAEEFLMQQPGVLNASCSVHRGKLVATVEVAANTDLTPDELMRACRSTLRPEYAPALIVFVQTEVESDEVAA